VELLQAFIADEGVLAIMSAVPQRGLPSFGFLFPSSVPHLPSVQPLFEVRSCLLVVKIFACVPLAEVDEGGKGVEVALPALHFAAEAFTLSLEEHGKYRNGHRDIDEEESKFEACHLHIENEIVVRL